MLSGMNGRDVCRELRRKGFEAPIQGKAESFAIQATPIEQIPSVVVHNELTVSPS
jgi:hypothetical protein